MKCFVICLVVAKIHVIGFTYLADLSGGEAVVNITSVRWVSNFRGAEVNF